MPMRNGYFWAGVVCALAGACSQIPPPPRLAADSHCYKIDGRDTFIFSSAFHYFRCPKPLWPARFQTLKEAGFNTVETYVAWNWHERQPPAGPDDFSQMDMTDLTDWLEMAINRFGFNVILRPGPYICAEWDGGGYPQWLVTRRPDSVDEGHWLRGDDPIYLQWCRHWYQAVAKAAGPYQITHRPAGSPGVILWQIENEYVYAPFDSEVKLHQLLALAHDARDFGIDVPLITCMTDDPLFRKDPYLRQNVTECRNTYPGYDPGSEIFNITRLDQYQPEKPRMITELQGGWFSEYGPGNKLSIDQGFTPEQISHVTLLAWAHGYSGTNYYMGFGGTNLGDWAAAGKTTTYDYAAPVHEWGGVGPRYFAVKSLGDLIRLHGPSLARSDAESIGTQNAPDDLTVISRRGSDGSRFLFVLNDRRSDAARGQFRLKIPGENAPAMNVDYDLGPFGAAVLYLPPGATDASEGIWYPRATSAPSESLPPAMAITQIRFRRDPGPAEKTWMPLPSGAGIEDMGIFDRRFVWYRYDFTAVAQIKSLRLSALLPDHDSFIAQLDGTLLSIHRHGSVHVGGWIPPLTPGRHSLLILYENGGRPNWGAGMEARCGLHDLSISDSNFFPVDINNWSIRLPNEQKWQHIDMTEEPKQVKAGLTGEFRAHVQLSQSDLQAGAGLLSVEHLRGQAKLTINGIDLGDFHRRQKVARALHVGDNTILITVTAGDTQAGISGAAEIDSVKHSNSLPINWEISGQTAGLAGQWFDPKFDDSDWQTLVIARSKPPAQSDPINPVWFRLHFQIPPGVIWKLHLNAGGNGFIYLNGHPLGRYWDVGPQTDFFLPGCWLNAARGSDNIVTLCLRPTTGPVAIRDAWLAPYGLVEGQN
ncbi:MAG: beta-galactosidase [Tepidisphaeraceae bacterium]|jgi:hypothetical protein